jgi:hypothetical protein
MIEHVLLLFPREVAEFVVVERHPDPGAVGHVDLEIGEAQRLGDQVIHQDLRAEMLAAPLQCGFRRKPPTYSDLMPPIVLT